MFLCRSAAAAAAIAESVEWEAAHLGLPVSSGLRISDDIKAKIGIVLIP